MAGINPRSSHLRSEVCLSWLAGWEEDLRFVISRLTFEVYCLTHTSRSAR
jgi:hypothetical protein